MICFGLDRWLILHYALFEKSASCGLGGLRWRDAKLVFGVCESIMLVL
jgi:hypothetical protein